MRETALISNSVEETVAVARRLGEALRGGEFVCLSGPLGAGKTHFAKGLALGLGIDPSEPIVSPTFTLIREYRGRLTLFHLDLYRLSGVEDVLSLGWEELRARSDAVVAVEWMERAPQLITPGAIRVTLAHESESQRRIQISGWSD